MTKHPENKYQRVLSEKKKRVKAPKDPSRVYRKRIRESLKDQETKHDLNSVLRTGDIGE